MKVNHTEYCRFGKAGNPGVPVIIAFEGIDGCGKTSVSKLVAETMGALCLHTPPENYKPVKPVFENNAGMIVPRFYYYLSGLWASYNYALEHASNGIVVFDRYILSTKLYHEAMFELNNLDFSVSDLPAFLFPPEPDMNIVLTAEECTVSRRINERGEVYDLSLEKDRKFQDYVNGKFLRTDSVIISSCGSPGETAEKCLNIIRQVLFNSKMSAGGLK
jgi:thymidylate kinase